MRNPSKLADAELRRAKLRLFHRIYLSHACIGVPLVLAGSMYIAFYLNLGASFMLVGVPAALLAPLPIALSEMKKHDQGKIPGESEK